MEQSLYDSEDELNFHTCQPGFFDGLGSKAITSHKQVLVRDEIREASRMEAAGNTLKDKIEAKRKFAAMRHKAYNRDSDHEQMEIERQQPQDADNYEPAKQRVIVEHPSSKDNKLLPKKSLRKMTFGELNIIKPIIRAIDEIGYTSPTPIQQLTIQPILSGKDVVASSITGSGKTAAFCIPILQRYFKCAPVGYIRAAVITPTRELAMQIYEEVVKLNKYTKLDLTLVIGASSIQKQERELRNHPELIIGTPGRILDLLTNSRSIGLEDLQVIVFDEADKLLELGFQTDIAELMKHINSEVQTILFSATMGAEVKKLATVTTNKPIRISADPDNKTAERLHQQVIKLRDDSSDNREAVLLAILQHLYKQKVIVFFKTKKECHRMAMIMGLAGLEACELHGNLSQTQRIEAFLGFKQGKFNYLLATDLASRGLDIKEVKSVINFQLPAQLTRYIHRVGRTARAGHEGASLTLCSQRQCLELKKMSRKTGDRLFKVEMRQQLVSQARKTIDLMQGDIRQIFAEQFAEMQARKAEMELQKLENITENQREIFSRPRKEWHLNQRQKKEIRHQAKAEIQGEDTDHSKMAHPKKGRPIHKNVRQNDSSGHKKQKVKPRWTQEDRENKKKGSSRGPQKKWGRKPQKH